MAQVVSVSKSASHSFSKPTENSINLIAGLGVEGDAHLGEKVKHRSRVRRDPNQPNLRQVHLMASELFDELKEKGFDISAGQMGENITTTGIDLINLYRDTELHIGDTRIRITGLRNPCVQLDNFQSGLMKALLEKKSDGSLIRKSGIMGIVLQGGEICVGDEIKIVEPEEKLAMETV